MKPQAKYLAAVIGAGPAGLFAARELASHDVHVSMINRDLKPGGLAEYGIYPSKHRMKEGLRAQFRQILALEDIDYYGNLTVGENGDIKLAELRALGYQAILITTGAQGTKWLGLPGENLEGVYHAKDVVYHYNRLPPFSQKKFHIGKRVAIIGAGNVMLDIAHFLATLPQVEEIIAVIRRGPAEIKIQPHRVGPCSPSDRPARSSSRNGARCADDESHRSRSPGIHEPGRFLLNESGGYRFARKN